MKKALALLAILGGTALSAAAGTRVKRRGYTELGKDLLIDPYIHDLVTNRVIVKQFVPRTNATNILKPVLMWYNTGVAKETGGDWVDYIYAFVRQVPWNGEGDVEAIVEFWDARKVNDKNYIQIEANRQSGGTVTMYIDNVPKTLEGYTGGFLYPHTNQVVWGQPLPKT